MPFYKFYVTLSDNSLHTGIRELLDQYDLERVWRTYEAISRKKYGYQLKSFKVVHLCKLDPEVREFLANRGKTANATNVWEFDLNEIPERKKQRDKSSGRDWGKEQH